MCLSVSVCVSLCLCVCVCLQVRALVQDMRQGLKVDLADIKHYLTAPGGFHVGALERELG